MTGNWLRIGALGLGLALCAPQSLWAQEAAGRSAPASSRSAATLDTVVVTATRTEEKLREVTSNVTVITEEMIQKSTAKNLGELLIQQGFQSDAGYNGSQRVRIRGIENNQAIWDTANTRVLIMLNGRRLNTPQVEFIGLNNVERVEIVRGPSAVQYGPSAMGGVINIITKRGGEKPEIKAEAGFGSYDLERLKLAASGQSPTGLVDFSFGAGQQNQGDYKTGEGWVREMSGTGNRIGFNGDLGLNLEEVHRIGFNYNFFGVNGSTHPNNYAVYPTKQPAPFSGYGSQDVTDHSMALTYDGATEDKVFNWQGLTAFGRYNAEYNSYGVVIPGPTYTQDRTVNLRNLAATVGYDNGGLFALSGGLDQLILKTESPTISTNAGTGVATYTPGNKPEYEDLGVFLSGKLRFLDDSLIFSAGGRFDSYEVERGSTTYNISESKTNFVPSVGVAYHPADWLKLRSNYSEGFKMPTPDQLGGTATYLENPDLEPEKTKSWEIGLDVNWEFVNAGLTYFNTKFKNKIAGLATDQPNPNSASNWYRYENLEGATYRGLELALSTDLGQAFNRDFTLRPYINLTHFLAMRNDDPEITRSPRLNDHRYDDMTNNAKTTMSYGLDFIEPNIDLMVNVNANYSGKKLSQDWSNSRTGETPANPWVYYTTGTLVNMSFEQRVWQFEDLGKLKLRGELNNVFDKYTETYINYPDPGRNFYLGLKYEY